MTAGEVRDSIVASLRPQFACKVKHIDFAVEPFSGSSATEAFLRDLANNIAQQFCEEE